MRRLRKLCQRGSKFDNVLFFFNFDEGRNDPKTIINGPSSTRQRNAINGDSPGCRLWPNIDCWLGSFTILRGSRPVLLNKPYIFVIFQGGGGGVRTTCSPLLSIHICSDTYACWLDKYCSSSNCRPSSLKLVP